MIDRKTATDLATAIIIGSLSLLGSYLFQPRVTVTKPPPQPVQDLAAEDRDEPLVLRIVGVGPNGEELGDRLNNRAGL